MQDIDILVSGKPVKKLAHDGKIFIVAKPGLQYEVRVKNNSSSRIMAVPSIDGLNTISGEPAETDGPGYVIDGFNSYTIKGWRTSNEEVRKFEFSKKDKSYAAKSEDGDVRNCGVIGIAIHAEKAKEVTKEYIPYYVDRPYPVYPPYYRPDPFYPWRSYPYYWDGMIGGAYNSSTQYTMTCSSSMQGNQRVMMNSCSNQGSNTGMLRSANFSEQSAPEFDIGTKFSESSLEDKVENTEFESSHVIQRIEIYYASEEQLRAMGVPVDKKTKVSFPEAFAGKGFCKVPEK